MNEPEVELVEPKTFTINFPSVGAPMAVRTEGDEIVILMRLTLRPRDDVMNINFDVSASRDGTSMARLDQNAPSDVSRYWRAPIPGS
jgi:hypothetical protein